MSEDWFEELEPFLSGEILNKDPLQMTSEELAEAYAFLQVVDKATDERKKALREYLLQIAVEEGHKTEKGGYIAEFDGTKVIRERRVATSPDSDKVKALLHREGLSLDAGFSKKTISVLDPSKLTALVDTGKLDGDEIDSLRDVNLALKVFPSNQIENKVREAVLEYREIFEDDIHATKIERRTRSKKDHADGPRKEK